MPELAWGLDVSADKAKTAAVALDWSSPGDGGDRSQCRTVSPGA